MITVVLCLCFSALGSGSSKHDVSMELFYNNPPPYTHNFIISHVKHQKTKH